MHCYYNLISSDRTIIDEEGIEVADLDEACTFARAAVAEMVQNGVAEIAHWRGWQIEARDASGAVQFTMSFDAALSAVAQQEPQAIAETVTRTAPTLTVRQPDVLTHTSAGAAGMATSANPRRPSVRKQV